MDQRSRSPREVREIEHVEIPLADGCRLAARIWMPVDAQTRPVPAILEYIPYRKNDLTAARDARMHPWTARHGYACVRVDLRGSGESDGVLRDEYLQQELDDGVEVIAWIARQPWCSGKVGMIGISWGGFNGLQIAALGPPALAAIVSCCSTDDRYADDVHYMGGCLLTENLSWASIMLARNTCPPDPRHVGERWREMWLERLKESGLWLEPWLEHQHRDAYWRHGSVCEDFSGIRCPVYAVSGWADGYCNAVFRLLAGLDVPRKGLVGPWAHTYPHIGRPGPAIGFLQECVRWWDHWLKGEDNGVMDGPMLRAWMQDSVRPQSAYLERPGRWVGEPAWPSTGIEALEMRLGGDGSLAATPDAGQPAALVTTTPLGVGLRGGKWCSYATPGDQPADQGADDAASLVFETAPLEQPLEILGEASVALELDSDRPVATIACRLNDVAPDGSATRVTYGLLNLTHRDGHAEPVALVPGERYRVRIPLKHVAQHFPAGHRLRLALSTSYWPVAWPSPEPVTLTIHTGSSRLQLPARAPRAEDAELGAAFPPPELGPAMAVAQRTPPDLYWRVVHDLAEDIHRLEVGDGQGTFLIEHNDLTVTAQGSERYAFRGRDHSSASGETCWEIGFERSDWRVRTLTRTRLTADAGTFRVNASLEAYEGERLVHEQSWALDVPRRLV